MVWPAFHDSFVLRTHGSQRSSDPVSSWFLSPHDNRSSVMSHTFALPCLRQYSWAAWNWSSSGPSECKSLSGTTAWFQSSLYVLHSTRQPTLTKLPPACLPALNVKTLFIAAAHLLLCLIVPLLDSGLYAGKAGLWSFVTAPKLFLCTSMLFPTNNPYITLCTTSI